LSQPNGNSNKKRDRFIIEGPTDDLLGQLLRIGRDIIIAEELADKLKTKKPEIIERPVIEPVRRVPILRERDEFINKTDHVIGQTYTEKIECAKYNAIDGKLMEFTLYSDSNEYSIYVECDEKPIVSDTFANLQNVSLAIESLIATQDELGKYMFSIADWTFKNHFYIGITPTTPGLRFDTIWGWFKLYVWE